ncbi:MAG: hypothetical protein IPN20_23740 [Haliscomenobacter sp.]|nr:hypothetical protein [Haliscomenobacter sp.]
MGKIIFIVKCSPQNRGSSSNFSSFVEMLNRLKNPLSFSIDCKDFKNLLLQLGEKRINRFNFRNILSSQPPALKEMGFRMGKRLADAVGLIQSFVPLNLVIVAGGPMADDALWAECEKGLLQEIDPYLYNRFYGEFKNLEKGGNDAEKEKSLKDIFYLRQGKDDAILGAAMLGFDNFVKFNKLKELQALATKEKGPILEDSIFLSFKEAEKFVIDNVSKLRITYDPSEGSITSIKAR